MYEWPHRPGLGFHASESLWTTHSNYSHAHCSRSQCDLQATPGLPPSEICNMSLCCRSRKPYTTQSTSECLESLVSCMGRSAAPAWRAPPQASATSMNSSHPKHSTHSICARANAPTSAPAHVLADHRATLADVMPQPAYRLQLPANARTRAPFNTSACQAVLPMLAWMTAASVW